MASFTSTTHDKFIPEQWKDETRVALEANLVYVKLIKNVPFDKKVKGDVLHIPDVSDLGDAIDLSEADTDIAGEAVTETEFTLTINKKKHKTLYFPKHLAEKLSHYDFRKEYTGKISYSLSKRMDLDVAGLFSGLSQAVGTTADGLNGNASDALLLAALEKLDTADVMEDDRVWIFHARQKSKLLAIDKFVRADAVGPDAVKIEKVRFGNIYNADIYFTSIVPVKLAATAPATPVDSHANLFMQREALAIAIPQDIDMDYGYIMQKKAYMLSGDVLYGVAEYRDVAGVVVFTKQTG